MFLLTQRYRRPRRLSLPCMVKLIAVIIILWVFTPYLISELTIYRRVSISPFAHRLEDNASQLSLSTELVILPSFTINETYPFEEGRGKINLDIWTKMCSLNLNSLKQFPLFPNFPIERHYISVRHSVEYVHDKTFTAIRIRGYLHPPSSGLYSFFLSTPLLAELWLSSSGPTDATRVAITFRNVIGKNIYYVSRVREFSEMIHLQQDSKYYFEIIQVSNDPISKPGKMALYWMLPDTPYYSKIAGSQISKYVNVSSIYKTPDFPAAAGTLPSLELSDDQDYLLGQLFPLDKQRTEHSKKPVFSLKQAVINQTLSEHIELDGHEYSRENASQIPHIENYTNDVLNAFTNCTFKQDFDKTRKIKRNAGVWDSYFLEVFPADESGLLRSTFPNDGVYQRDKPNFVIKENDVVRVVTSFMEELNNNSKSKYKLNSIINVERHSPKGPQPEKYFLELVLRHTSDRKLFRFSEYFFKFKKKNSLYVDPDVRWNYKVWVYVILNVRKQPGWVLYFVKEMARILKVTSDEYVHFIVADYGNEGIDIAKEMSRHGIKHHTVSKVEGAFHKTFTINQAVAKVQNPNSIVFQIDLHLQIPNNIFDVIRKHTIQGRSGFAPQVLRMTHCGRPKTKHVYPEGFYETMGFGIFSIYKSDWDKFGGMNEKEFKNKWGGEDWEMVDRIIMASYSIEKLRLPGFYHFYHDRAGMWNQ